MISKRHTFSNYEIDRDKHLTTKNRHNTVIMQQRNSEFLILIGIYSEHYEHGLLDHQIVICKLGFQFQK